VISVGEELTVFTNVTNTGNIPAWDIAWEAPQFGFNTSNLNGIIAYLNTSDSVVVNTTYIVDAATRYLIDYASGSDISLDSAPTRHLGGVIDLGAWGRPDSDNGRDYSWWYLDGWWANNSYFPINNPNWNSGDVYANEIRLHILPEANQTLGPFLAVQVEYSSVHVSSEERLTVSVTIRNAGDMPAENVDVTSEYSDSEFNFFAGIGTDNSQFPPQGRRVEFQWGILAAGDSFTFSYQLVALKNTKSYTYTYVATDWGKFPGLVRVFYPRTFDWEAPIISGPADEEIIRRESVATAGTLSWPLSDEHSGTYRILLANASSAISSDNATAIASANLTFVQIASGRWSTAFSNHTHSLADLNDGFYLFSFEATDCCGNIATDMVAVTVVTVMTQPEQEDEGVIEDFQSFLSENTGFLLIIGVLAVIVIAEGVVIYFMRK
jgi:hypothetical protein